MATGPETSRGKPTGCIYPTQKGCDPPSPAGDSFGATDSRKDARSRSGPRRWSLTVISKRRMILAITPAVAYDHPFLRATKIKWLRVPPVGNGTRSVRVRNSKTLAKLRSGQPVRMCGLSGHFLPAYVRHAAHQGYDCIWLDLEHRAMDQRELQALLAFFHLADIDCMVRAPTLEKTKLYRLLEDGAAGIMIPHVSTAEKARMLVQALKFPPLGDRGYDGAGLDTDFILQGSGDYTDRANAETFLVVQIETIDAVRNVDEIAAVPGVDILFVGPADLNLRLKHQPDSGLTYDECLNRVAAAAKKHGKNWGLPVGSPEQVQQMREKGARFINFGGDFGAVLEMLEGNARKLDGIYGPRLAAKKEVAHPVDA